MVEIRISSCCVRALGRMVHTGYIHEAFLFPPAILVVSLAVPILKQRKRLTA